MVVTIKKGYPVQLPPFKRIVNLDGTIGYVAYDWRSKPMRQSVLTNPNQSPFANQSETPLYGLAPTMATPTVYPRSYYDAVGLLSSIAPLLASNGILNAAAPGAGGYLFTLALEPNSFDVVDDANGSPQLMQSTVGDRWQGGDALLMSTAGPLTSENWYTVPNVPGPPDALASTQMINHDLAIVASVVGAFQRVKFLWFYENTDMSGQSNDTASILTGAAAGLTYAELHVTNSRAQTIAIALAAAHSFFGV